MMRLFLLIFVMITVSFDTYADCGQPASGNELINQADLIFIGTVVKSKPNYIGYLTFSRYNHYTRFKLNELLKGDVNGFVDIYYNYSEGVSPTIKPKVYKIGEKFIIFARNDGRNYYFSPCFSNRISMKYNVLPRNMNIQTMNTILALVHEFPNLREAEIKDTAMEICQKNISLPLCQL